MTNVENGKEARVNIERNPAVFAAGYWYADRVEGSIREGKSLAGATS